VGPVRSIEPRRGQHADLICYGLLVNSLAAFLRRKRLEPEDGLPMAA
jgi:hypothetical protein